MKPIAGWLLLWALLFALDARAQAQDPTDAGAAPPTQTSQATEREAPPAPEPAGTTPAIPRKVTKDWIRLTSGEWLRGEFTLLQDEVVEFDSDELDELRIDWEDVTEVRCAGMMTSQFDDRTVITGTLWIREGEVLIDAGDGPQRFRRSELRAVVRGRPRERNYWSGKLGAGFTARRGNTEQTDLTISASARRRTPATRLDMNYDGLISEVEEEQIANNHRFDGKFDYFVNRRLFVTPLSLDLLNDRFQNIAARATPGIGIGYTLLDVGGSTLDVGLGGGYRYTRYREVEEGEDETDGTAAGLGTIAFEHDLTKTVELELNYRVQLGIPDTQDSLQHFDGTVSIELWDSFDLDVSFIWDRVGDPEPDSDGIKPEKDDIRMTVGVSYEF